MCSSATKKAASGAPTSSWPTRPSNATILQGLYVATTLLCVFMIFWILVFPSSWLVGRNKLHDDILIRHLSKPNQVTSMELVTKYKGHSAVHLTHTLPGVVWAGAIPFQLHPTLRKQHKTLHRMVGYVFVVTCVIMTAGVLIILKRGLLYEESFPDLEPPRLSVAPGILFQSCWFLCTMAMATLKARAKQFASHQAWIIRHVSSGIWVSLQRILLLTVMNRPPFTRQEQRQVFGDAAIVAIGICFSCGELAIYLLQNQQQAKEEEGTVV